MGLGPADVRAALLRGTADFLSKCVGIGGWRGDGLVTERVSGEYVEMGSCHGDELVRVDVVTALLTVSGGWEVTGGSVAITFSIQ